MVALPWLVATLLLTVALGAPAPVPGLDPSWRLALNTAADAQFGRDIVFTYGPWGYLDVPLITSRGAYGLALLFRAGVIAALWLVSVRGLTQRWPLWLAAPVVSVFVVLVASSDLSTLVVAVTAQYVLWHALAPSRPEQRGAALIRVAGLAALAGLMIQVKFSHGLAVAALAALAVATHAGSGSRRHRLARWGCAAVSFLGVAGAAWLARGQSLADVGAWVRGSVEITAGYPETMSFELPDPGVFAYAMAGLLGLLTVAAATPRLRELRASRSVGVLLVLGVVGGFAFKSAFTRHDDFHEGVYFVIVGAVFLVLVGTSGAGSWLAALGAILAIAMASTTLPTATGPATAARRWHDDVSILVSRDHQVHAVAGAREAMIASYQVPDAIVRRLGDRPVSIDPYEVAVAWAYELNWRPVPVFQLYAAYTPALDQLNADALRQAPARQLVLRHEGSFADGRNPLWDAPLYHRALACGYRTVVAKAWWTLLAKGPPRCGRPESLGREHVPAENRVEVPAATGTDIVLARFTPDAASVLVRLGRALVKPYTPMVVTADATAYRLSRQTSASGVIVTFPAVEAGAYAPLDIRSLVFSEPGTLEFVRIPVTQ